MTGADLTIRIEMDLSSVSAGCCHWGKRYHTPASCDLNTNQNIFSPKMLRLFLFAASVFCSTCENVKGRQNVQQWLDCRVNGRNRNLQHSPGWIGSGRSKKWGGGNERALKRRQNSQLTSSNKCSDKFFEELRNCFWKLSFQLRLLEIKQKRFGVVGGGVGAP